MDDIGALMVFRVRGRYYSIFDSDTVNCVPSGIGKRFMSEIPLDPDAFEGSLTHLCSSIPLTVSRMEICKDPALSC